MKGSGAQRVLLIGVVLMSALLIGYVSLSDPSGQTSARAAQQDIPLNAERAYQYLKDICAIGTRVSGTEGMLRQQELLTKHFTELGGQVELQKFPARHPLTGAEVPMANLIVRWHPEKKERLLLCAHYDTRPFPDADRQNPRGVFIGANDGASGAAVLMELAHHMQNLDGPLGIDFVLFDGEELVYQDTGEYFLGSKHFAREYLLGDVKYRWGVLMDMVGGKDLTIPKDYESVRWRDVRPLVNDIWRVARRLGVREFVNSIGTPVSDDHIHLHNDGGIAVCDLINFNYPYWHKTQDTPENCSGESLVKVGWVLHEWIIETQKQ